MYDLVSWIEKDGKRYWLRDSDKVEGGYEAIRKVHNIEGGVEKRSPLHVPLEIAESVNKGELKRIAKSGGWAGLHFDKRGYNDTPYWRRFKDEFEKWRRVKLSLDNHGPVLPEWRVLETWKQAREQLAVEGYLKDYDASLTAWDACLKSAEKQGRTRALFLAVRKAARFAIRYFIDAEYMLIRDWVWYVSSLISDRREESEELRRIVGIWSSGYMYAGSLHNKDYVSKE